VRVFALVAVVVAIIVLDQFALQRKRHL
jgi:hypothetical protein